MAIAETLAQFLRLPHARHEPNGPVEQGPTDVVGNAAPQPHVGPKRATVGEQAE